jgi:hypothetical protein
MNVMQEPFRVDTKPVAIVSGLGTACHKSVEVSYYISRFTQYYSNNFYMFHPPKPFRPTNWRLQHSRTPATVQEIHS